MILSIPLLIVAVGAYNIIALATGPAVTTAAFSFGLPSAAAVTLTVGDLLVLIGLASLFFEIFKATRTSTASIIDHLLSVALFIACLLELLLLPAFGTATFLLLTAMALIDVIAGFTVTIVSARRDIGLDQSALGR